LPSATSLTEKRRGASNLSDDGGRVVDLGARVAWLSAAGVRRLDDLARRGDGVGHIPVEQPEQLGNGELVGDAVGQADPSWPSGQVRRPFFICTVDSTKPLEH
jgi:hypothetical protein